MTKAERATLLRSRFQAIKSPFWCQPIQLKHSQSEHRRRRFRFKPSSDNWNLDAGNALLAHQPEWAKTPVPTDRHELRERRQVSESPYVAIARQLLPARLPVLD